MAAPFIVYDPEIFVATGRGEDLFFLTNEDAQGRYKMRDMNTNSCYTRSCQTRRPGRST